MSIYPRLDRRSSYARKKPLPEGKPHTAESFKVSASPRNVGSETARMQRPMRLGDTAAPSPRPFSIKPKTRERLSIVSLWEGRNRAR